METEPFKSKSVVLVHGAFADGSSWSRVIEILLDAGLHAVAVQNPLTSLTRDVWATERVLEMQQEPTILVGHSYGGTVISEAGMHPRVSGLVYVAALAPRANEDVEALRNQHPRSPALNYLRCDGRFVQLDEVGFERHFAPDVPERRVLARSQVPADQTLFDQRIRVAAWETRPSWYAVSTDDQVIDPGLQRFFAQRIPNVHTIDVPASHASPLSQPQRIAHLIMDAARAVP